MCLSLTGIPPTTSFLWGEFRGFLTTIPPGPGNYPWRFSGNWTGTKDSLVIRFSPGPAMSRVLRGWSPVLSWAHRALPGLDPGPKPAEVATPVKISCVLPPGSWKFEWGHPAFSSSSFLPPSRLHLHLFSLFLPFKLCSESRCTGHFPLSHCSVAFKASLI